MHDIHFLYDIITVTVCIMTWLPERQDPKVKVNQHRLEKDELQPLLDDHLLKTYIYIYIHKIYRSSITIFGKVVLAIGMSWPPKFPKFAYASTLTEKNETFKKKAGVLAAKPRSGGMVFMAIWRCPLKRGQHCASRSRPIILAPWLQSFEVRTPRNSWKTESVWYCENHLWP